MITWKRANPLPDGPEDSSVVDAFHGNNSDGEQFFLVHLVYNDGERGEYATLGVLGRLPKSEEADQAAEKIGWENVKWDLTTPGISLIAPKP